jgi:hypothetical protein
MRVLLADATEIGHLFGAMAELVSRVRRLQSVD